MLTLPKICLLILLGLILMSVLICLFRVFVSTETKDVPSRHVPISQSHEIHHTRHSNQLVATNHLTPFIKTAWVNTITEQVKRFYYLADAPVRKFLQSKGWLSANN
jgi:CBS domain containing-hemolysin-like protein